MAAGLRLGRRGGKAAARVGDTLTLPTGATYEVEIAIPTGATAYQGGRVDLFWNGEAAGQTGLKATGGQVTFTRAASPSTERCQTS